MISVLHHSAVSDTNAYTFLIIMGLKSNQGPVLIYCLERGWRGGSHGFKGERGGISRRQQSIVGDYRK